MMGSINNIFLILVLTCMSRGISGGTCNVVKRFTKNDLSGSVDRGLEVELASATNINIDFRSADTDMIYEICDSLCDRERVFKTAYNILHVVGHKLRIEFVYVNGIKNLPYIHLTANVSCSSAFVDRQTDYFDKLVLVKQRETNRTVSWAQRAVSPVPSFVSMMEGLGMNIIWTVPLDSVYGVYTLALAGGSQFYVGHEYVKLRAYEDVFHVAVVPGMGYSSLWISGVHNDPTGGGQGQGYKVPFRYSARDAAWIGWHYGFNRPAYLGPVTIEAWRDRTGVVPSTIGAQLYEISPPTLKMVGFSGTEYYHSNGTLMTG